MHVEKIELKYEDNIGIFHFDDHLALNSLLNSEISRCGSKKSSDNPTQENHNITGINFYNSRNYSFLRLKKWVEYCVKKFMSVDANKLNGVIFEDIWANRYEKGDYIRRHRHLPNTYAFVYFVQSTKDHPPLSFDGSHFSFQGKDGDLIVFNASLWHHVEKNMIELPRITISGNIQSTSVLSPNYENHNSNLSMFNIPT